MPWWVVAFDCDEACLVKRETREEAAKVVDPLGCKAATVYAPAEVVLDDGFWKKDGVMRCKIVEVF